MLSNRITENNRDKKPVIQAIASTPKVIKLNDPTYLLLIPLALLPILDETWLLDSLDFLFPAAVADTAILINRDVKADFY